MARKKNRNANYDFQDLGDRKFKEMGGSSFANMPDNPIYFSFDRGSSSYRDGIMNNPATGVEDISKIDENGCR